MRKRVALLLTVLFCFCVGEFSHAGEPADHIRTSVERVIGLLKDPGLKPPDRKLDRRNMIFKVLEDQFDFTEMSKRSLGEFWDGLSESQQKDFEVAFSSFLEKSYITRIERYTDEKVVFGSEKPKGEKNYTVHTEIVSGGRSIPVDYSLHSVSNQWLVYDVSIEGVSLVSSYRFQFREAFRKGGFDALMKLLDEKTRKVSEE